MDKFCVNCVHFVDNKNSQNLRCTKDSHINPVTGEKIASFADLNRKYDTSCGLEGKWFEPKPPEPVKQTWSQRFWDYLYDNSSYTKLL